MSLRDLPYSFTKDLQGLAKSEDKQPPKIRAIIEGLYSRELDLELYKTVLLFATGIRIAGQLPYIIQLLEGFYNCKVKTENIALFWELDSEYKVLIPLYKSSLLIVD
jgi:hypothetical protein